MTRQHICWVSPRAWDTRKDCLQCCLSSGWCGCDWPFAFLQMSFPDRRNVGSTKSRTEQAQLSTVHCAAAELTVCDALISPSAVASKFSFCFFPFSTWTAAESRQANEANVRICLPARFQWLLSDATHLIAHCVFSVFARSLTMCSFTDAKPNKSVFVAGNSSYM